MEMGAGWCGDEAPRSGQSMNYKSHAAIIQGGFYFYVNLDVNDHEFHRQLSVYVIFFYIVDFFVSVSVCYVFR